MDLAQGEELFPVKFTFSYTDSSDIGWDCTRVIAISWSEIFQGVGSLMLDGLSESQFRGILNKVVEGAYLDSGEKDKDEDLEDCDRVEKVIIDWRDEQTIKIQFRALGLIEYSKGKGSAESEWRLTAFGDLSLLKLCAVHKDEYKYWNDGDEESPETTVPSDEPQVLVATEEV